VEDPPVPSRNLSAREVRFVVRRSAEIQRREALAVAEGQSDEYGELTTADLEQVATEVGVDPYYLQRAADELEDGGLPIDFASLAGGPFSLRLEHVLPGELDEDQLRELIPEIEMAITSKGGARVTPRTLLWRTRDSNELMPLQVAVRVRGGNTRIGIEQRLYGLVGALYGGGIGGIGAGVGIGVGFGVGLGALDSPGFALVFSTICLAGSFAICRQVLAIVRRHRQTRLLDLLDRLCERTGVSED